MPWSQFLSLLLLLFASITKAASSCGRVIIDESQARECLNLTDDTVTPVPLPVVFENAVSDSNYICKNKKPMFTFHCTIHGKDLIWVFSNEPVTVFISDDSVGRIVSVAYPRGSHAVYRVTAVLTNTSKVPGTSISTCTSLLTLQPFNERKIQVLPFSVSCQTHCPSLSNSADQVCMSKEYEVTATPTKPREVTGNIIQEGVASVSWLPPDNENETAIDYYEVTLSGPNISSITVKVDAAATLPYKFMPPEGNFSDAEVNVTAVDVCGLRSEPAQSAIKSDSTESSPSTSTCSIERQEQLQSQVIILTVLVIVVLVYSTVIIVTLAVTVYVLRRGTDSVSINSACNSGPSKYENFSDVTAKAPQTGEKTAPDERLSTPVETMKTPEQGISAPIQSPGTEIDDIQASPLINGAKAITPVNTNNNHMQR